MMCKINPKNDEYYTTVKACEYLFQFLPSPEKCGLIWDPSPGPTNNQNEICQSLIKKGYSVICTSDDFLSYKEKPNSQIKMIISNPPFSLKNKFIWQSMELGLPYLFLLPLHSLNSEIRAGWWRTYSLQLWIIPEQLRFTDTKGQKKRCSFNISWFGWRITNQNSTLEFLELL
jgi:hypothetical protein